MAIQPTHDGGTFLSVVQRMNYRMIKQSVVCGPIVASQPDGAMAIDWPQEFNVEPGTIVVDLPQLEELHGNVLPDRAAGYGGG